MRLLTLSAVAAASLVACSHHTDPGGPPAPCDPATQACSLSHTVATFHVDAGQEITGACMSWTLNNDADLWVNAVAADNDGYVHHSNWFWVPDRNFDVPDGAWTCADNKFDELAGAIVGGVLFAQSTQARSEVQKFLPGVAVLVPAHSRVIATVHLLNASTMPVDTSLRTRIDTLPPAQVTTHLTPFRLSYYDLAIPANGKSAHTGSCDIATPYASRVGGAFDLKLHYVLPHYHQLGSGFRLDYVGGPHDGETFFMQGGMFGEPLGHTFPTPLDFAALGATGIRFTCEHTNPRAVSVGWGVGDQEMCMMLGFAETHFKFDATVDKTSDTSTDASGEVHHSGACGVIGVQVN
jgi:hypothetical protein